MSATPIDGLTLRGSVSHIDSEIQGGFSNFNYLGQFQNFSGEPFPHTPKWQGNGDVEYRFDATDNYEAFLGANVAFRTETNAGFGQLPELIIEDYTLIDLRAGLESDVWRFQVWGKNVTDKYYFTETARLFGDSLVRYAGQPATYGVTVGYKF